MAIDAGWDAGLKRAGTHSGILKLMNTNPLVLSAYLAVLTSNVQ
jgi:hypothetical protein